MSKYIPRRADIHQVHRPQKAEPTRGPRLYDSRRWKTLSKLFLGKPENALCRACQSLGITTPAQCVDHIQPHRGNPSLFWQEDNWQSLCAPCHGIKTAIETRGSAKAFPTLLGKPANHVTLVCGAPGSGRLAWAQQQPGRVVDPSTIAAGYADTPRHQAPAHWVQAARAEVNRQLAEYAEQPIDRLLIIIECAGHGERREWRKRTRADRVVILECEPADCVARGGPGVAEVAARWWKGYTRGHDEEEIRCE